MVCSANVKIAETYAYAKFCINGQFAAKFLVITLFIVNLLLTGIPMLRSKPPYGVIPHRLFFVHKANPISAGTVRKCKSRLEL